MDVKLLIPIPSSFYTYLSIFLFLFCTISVNAQCAGNDDNTLSVCNITDISSKTIDLGARLGPHTAGGTWTDNGLSGGLNVATGILNAQQINRSGIFTYTYTVNNVVGCTDNSATVTITIGPYAGVGTKGNTCSDDTSFNLFQPFDMSKFMPQINGTWHDDDGSGGLSGNILDATIPVAGTYRYTYTVGAVGVCSVPSTQQIEVTIVPVPKPGTATPLKLCSDQLSAYTNYNLNNALSGQDLNGTWKEVSTNELSGSTDSNIDIQNIYNTNGPGTYTFSYTVGSGSCPRSSDVNITIEKKLDFTGLTLDINRDICEDEISSATYTAVLKQVPPVIANGSYDVTYTISGVALPFTTRQLFNNGVFSFPIASSNFQQVNDYTITILNIANAGVLPAICSNITGTASHVLHVYPIPKINNASLKIDPKCQNEDLLVEFSGTSNLTDGNYEIFYNISGSNIVPSIATIVTVGGGKFSFPILATLIPKAGKSTVTITNITNSATLCPNTSTLSGDFIVNALPNISNLAVTIKDVCQGEPATVQLTGLDALSPIALTYNISGFNTVPSQTIPLTVNAAGEVTFSILATEIPITGLTSFTITNVANAITGCSIAINKNTDFTVNPIPATPVADAVQPFCTSVNATVANLSPQGSQYQWFDSATSTIPLISTTPLISGNYFVKEVNALTKCESGLQTTSVVINTTPQINSAIVEIPLICQGLNANVNFATGTTNLTDGNYDILYNLSGSNTTATPVSTILTVTNGMPSFVINSNLIPRAGNTTIAITNIKNSLTNCSNTSTLSKVFVINALPDVSTMVVTVKDGCLGQPLNVQLSGLGTLTNITLSYAVSGTNTIDSQTIPLVVSAGNTSFLIPAASLLNTGNNTLVVTDLTNTGNNCSTIINSVSRNFAINAIPNSPTASNQEFCETNLATVANLVPNGNQYQWFDSVTSVTPLSSSALLATANYYLKEISAITGCASNPTSVGVLINSVIAPILNPSGQNFCGVDKPTIQNLSNNVTASGNLAWYDAVTNGRLLTNSDLLSEGFTYYGIDSSAITNCRSYALEVTVSLTDCTATPENFFIPDGFSPNGDGVNETFQIIDIEFLFPNYTLEIFNRYGNVLFKGDINKPAWDGKNSNSNFIDGDTPTGVYFYIIHYNKDNLPPKQGQLYLNR